MLDNALEKKPKVFYFTALFYFSPIKTKLTLFTPQQFFKITLIKIMTVVEMAGSVNSFKYLHLLNISKVFLPYAQVFASSYAVEWILHYAGSSF